MQRYVTLALVGLVLAGCRKDEAPPAAGAAAEPAATEAPMSPGYSSASHEQAAARLHEEGLVRDDEVADSMRAMVKRAQEGGSSYEAEAPTFLAWLKAWEERNPARADSARALHKRTQEWLAKNPPEKRAKADSAMAAERKKAGG